MRAFPELPNQSPELTKNSSGQMQGMSLLARAASMASFRSQTEDQKYNSPKHH